MLNQVKKLLGIKSKPSQVKKLSIDWVLPGKLALGRLPRSGESLTLKEANIKVVLSLCSEAEGTLPDDISQNFQCFRVVLPDRFYETQLTVEELTAAVNIVRDNMEKQLPIYVHCVAAIERSPTVCIAYLCKYHQMELWEAISWLKQVHPISVPHPSAMRAIREFIK